MELYPLRSNTLLANRQRRELDDMADLKIVGYRQPEWGAWRRACATVPALQIAGGLYLLAKWLGGVHDMERDHIAALYGSMSAAKQAEFASEGLKPDAINTVIRDSGSVHFRRSGPRRRALPLFTFGTAIMMDRWLCWSEYTGVNTWLQRRGINYDGASCEESWWLTATHEYAHLLHTYMTWQPDHTGGEIHGHNFCVVMQQVRQRHPFSTFPKIAIMPDLEFYRPDGTHQYISGRRVGASAYEILTTPPAVTPQVTGRITAPAVAAAPATDQYGFGFVKHR